MDAKRKIALHELSKGRSLRDVGRELSVPKSTLQN